MRMLFFDREGAPISSHQWQALAADTAYQRVDDTVLDGRVRVSTVWVGINYNFRPSGPPLIFETAIFGLPDGSEWFQRFPSEELAREGHAFAVLYAGDLLANVSAPANDRVDED